MPRYLTGIYLEGEVVHLHTTKWLSSGLISCWLMLLSINALADNQVEVASQLREVGYMIGDRVHQTITVKTPEGYVLDAGSLPTRDTGGNVELHEASWHTVKTVEGMQHVLLLEWQIFRAMREVRPLPLRPLELVFRRDESVLHVPLPASRVVVSPLLPTTLDRTQVIPRADVTPVQWPLQPLLLSLGLSLLGLILCLMYFGWRYGWLNAACIRQTPLRVAWKKIRRQHKHEAESSEFMLLIRRALDETAGCAISRERLADLFQRCHWLLPIKNEIAAFYIASDRTFFAGASSEMSPRALRQFARKLAMLESA